MIYKCQDCDYTGDKVFENDDYDNICPECGCDSCIEFEEMTKSQCELLNDFFENAKFVQEHHKYTHGGNTYVELIDDKKILNRYLDENKHWVYTMVECDGNETWIVPGFHYVNRIGYYITTESYDMPSEGIREF